MLQNPCKTLGFKKNMVYEIPPGGGKPYSASGLFAFKLNRGSCMSKSSIKFMGRVRFTLYFLSKNILFFFDILDLYTDVN